MLSVVAIVGVLLILMSAALDVLLVRQSVTDDPRVPATTSSAGSPPASRLRYRWFCVNGSSDNSGRDSGPSATVFEGMMWAIAGTTGVAAAMAFAMLAFAGDHVIPTQDRLWVRVIEPRSVVEGRALVYSMWCLVAVLVGGLARAYRDRLRRTPEGPAWP